MAMLFARRLTNGGSLGGNANVMIVGGLLATRAAVTNTAATGSQTMLRCSVLPNTRVRNRPTTQAAWQRAKAANVPYRGQTAISK